jgi:hypothetical protein
MLSKKLTLQSTTSTHVSSKDISNKPETDAFANDVKIIFVKSNKRKSKHSIINSFDHISQKLDSSYNPSGQVKSILKKKKKMGSALNEDLNAKEVKFVDTLGKRLTNVTVVPSYAMFYDKIYNDDETAKDKTDKVYSKCGCLIF